MNIKNKTVLITGGGAGIGLAIAKLLSDEGNRVIITGRSEARLNQALGQLKNATAIVGDVTSEKDVADLVSRVKKDFSDLSILINNAGFGYSYELNDNVNAFTKAHDEIITNYLSVVRLTEALLPVLKKQQASAIVNVTSIVVFAASGILPTYSASKSALHAYTQVLRHSLVNTSVKVFELMPPLVNTDLTKEIGGEENGIPPEQVASELLSGLQADQFEVHVDKTAHLYKAFLASPAEAFAIMNTVAA